MNTPTKKNTQNRTPVSESRLEDSQVFNYMNNLSPSRPVRYIQNPHPFSPVNIEGESRFFQTHNSSSSDPTDAVESREDESTSNEEAVPKAEIKNDASTGKQALTEMELLQRINYYCSGTNLDTSVPSLCGTGEGIQNMQPNLINAPEFWDAIPSEDVSFYHHLDFEFPGNEQTLSENNTAVCESLSRWVSPVIGPQHNPIVMSPDSEERRILQCMPCNCKMSMCLKLFCECFSAGLYCIESCSCVDCFNKPIHDNLVLATRKLIDLNAKFEESWDAIPYEDVSLFHRLDFEVPGNEQTLSENNTAVCESSSRWVSSGIGRQLNPIVMSPESEKRRISQCTPCNCKMSMCLKLFCECFSAGIYCTEFCSCVDCFNKPIHDNLVLATRKLIDLDAKFEDPYAGFEFQAPNLFDTCKLEGGLKCYEDFPYSYVGIQTMQTMQPDSKNAPESSDTIPYEDFPYSCVGIQTMHPDSNNAPEFSDVIPCEEFPYSCVGIQTMQPDSNNAPEFSDAIPCEDFPYSCVGIQTMQPDSNNAPEFSDAIPCEDFPYSCVGIQTMQPDSKNAPEFSDAIPCEEFPYSCVGIQTMQPDSNNAPEFSDAIPCEDFPYSFVGIQTMQPDSNNAPEFSDAIPCEDFPYSCVGIQTMQPDSNNTPEFSDAISCEEFPYSCVGIQTMQPDSNNAPEFSDAIPCEDFPYSCVGIQTMQPDSNNAPVFSDVIPYEDVSLFHRSDFEMPGNKQTLSENNTAIRESSQLEKPDNVDQPSHNLNQANQCKEETVMVPVCNISTNSKLYNHGFIKYTKLQKKVAISRFKEKKKTLKFGKHIRYEDRKVNAQSKTRIRGRFSKAEQDP